MKARKGRWPPTSRILRPPEKTASPGIRLPASRTQEHKHHQWTPPSVCCFVITAQETEQEAKICESQNFPPCHILPAWPYCFVVVFGGDFVFSRLLRYPFTEHRPCLPQVYNSMLWYISRASYKHDHNTTQSGETHLTSPGLGFFCL